MLWVLATITTSAGLTASVWIWSFLNQVQCTALHLSLVLVSVFVVALTFQWGGVLLYHTYRARRIMLRYYSPEVLQTRGYRLDEDISRHVSKEAFRSELSAFREHLTQRNSQRAPLSPSRVPLEERVDTRGLYGPESKVWIVLRESAAFFGGGRAVFLQLAHPYVAAGVREHSKVASDIQRRFYNTFYHVFRLSFGELKVAERSARQVRFVHDRIMGQLKNVPHYPEGSQYTASHEGALIWVWATLVDTAMLMYELLVCELCDADKEEYYQDYSEFIRFFGVSPSSLPPSWPAFREYMGHMWNSDILTVSDTAKEMEAQLFRPKSFIAGTANREARRLTFALLPPRLADDFGCSPALWEYGQLYLFFGASRMVYSILPGSFRYLSAYWEAEQRIAGEPVHTVWMGRLSSFLASWFMRNIVMNESQNSSAAPPSHVPLDSTTLESVD